MRMFPRQGFGGGPRTQFVVFNGAVKTGIVPQTAAGWLAVGGALFCLTPWASPPLALALGVALALLFGNPFPKQSARASKWLLKASVVGLGFGMSLGRVWQAGANGIVYTILGIATALTLGLLLGLWLRVERDTSWLITAGTSICGGSAIAAVGGAIRAGEEAMTVALGTVFILNAVALYLFPLIGHALAMTQAQFAVWAAVAIHDTSSVVGAAASYGPQALAGATVLKLARALWIAPLAVVAALLARRDEPAAERRSIGVPIPGFIVLFLAAALVRTLVPAALFPALDAIVALARIGLVLTLFLIGLGLSRAAIRRVGARPFLQGVLLWVMVAGLTLLMVERWVGPG